MIRKGCNSSVRTEEILTCTAWVGMTSYVELLNKFQYPEGSLLSLSNAMVDCDFLTKNKNGYYSLGIKNYKLGCQASHRQNVLEATRQSMQELPLKGRLICHLGAMGSISTICLDKVESPDSVPTGRSRIGKRLKLRITALDEVLLAQKTRGKLSYFLETLTLTPHARNTSIDKRLFLEELQRARLRGWAIDNEESTYGAICLNAPIFDIYSRVSCAISLSGDPVVYSGDKIDSYLELLRKCAEQISYGLGYRNESKHLREGN